MVIDIKRCIDEKIAIWCTSPQQAQQIWDDYHIFFHKKPLYKEWEPNTKDNFEVFFTETMLPSWQDRYNKTYFIDQYEAKVCLDYNEVLLKRIYELW